MSLTPRERRETNIRRHTDEIVTRIQELRSQLVDHLIQLEHSESDPNHRAVIARDRAALQDLLTAVVDEFTDTAEIRRADRRDRAAAFQDRVNAGADRQQSHLEHEISVNYHDDEPADPTNTPADNALIHSARIAIATSQQRIDETRELLRRHKQTHHDIQEPDTTPD